jgi:hypothetical protein
MNLHDFSQDIVPIISLIVATIGLLFIWLQIKAATAAINLNVESLKQAQKDFQQTSAWNKINSTYSYFNLERNSEIENRLYEAGAKEGLKFDRELTGAELQKVIATPSLFAAAKEWLNDFESYCAAYRIGALDKELAFRLLGTRISKEYLVFRHFIEYLRAQFKDIGILYEFETVASEWYDRLKKEESERSEVLKRSLEGARVHEKLIL